ncbi:MAG: sugar phosphate isomerase/epimerase family protein [Terriglobia bacterium]
MNRREFLSSAGSMASLVAAAGTTGLWAARTPRAPQYYYDPARLLRAGVSSRSFRNFFASTREKTFRLPGPMITLLDFPGIISDRYQVHHLEFASPHFATTEPEYLAQLRKAIGRARSRLVNIPVKTREITMGAGLSDHDPSVRDAAVAAVKKWIDVAHDIRSDSVSADPGSINGADISPTLDSYRKLSAYGRLRRVDVLIENHQGAEPGEIIDIVRQVGGRTLGALPDFSNFPNPAARARGLELLFPRALTVCHAKGISFDGQGNETTFDFKQCVDISRRSHFRGIYSVEFAGPGDPYQGVQHVINELIRYL